jgi:hypothetical protein
MEYSSFAFFAGELVLVKPIGGRKVEMKPSRYDANQILLQNFINPKRAANV